MVQLIQNHKEIDPTTCRIKGFPFCNYKLNFCIQVSKFSHFVDCFLSMDAGEYRNTNISITLRENIFKGPIDNDFSMRREYFNRGFGHNHQIKVPLDPDG